MSSEHAISYEHILCPHSQKKPYCKHNAQIGYAQGDGNTTYRCTREIGDVCPVNGSIMQADSPNDAESD